MNETVQLTASEMEEAIRVATRRTVLSDALGMDVDLPAPDEEMDEFAQQYWEFKVQEAGKAAARRWREALNKPDTAEARTLASQVREHLTGVVTGGPIDDVETTLLEEAASILDTGNSARDCVGERDS